MLHNVRILGPDGKTKRIIDSAKLSRRHWKNFAKAESKTTLVTAGQSKAPGWLKKKLEMEYPDYQDATCYH